MGTGGVEISVTVGAAPQIAGHILQLPRKLGRAAGIATAVMPTPGAYYVGEARELLVSHPVLLQLTS